MAYGIKIPEYPEGCTIVFGGSGGLGKATAGLMAERGSDILVTYRSRAAEAEAFAEELRGTGRRGFCARCEGLRTRAYRGLCRRSGVRYRPDCRFQI